MKNKNSVCAIDWNGTEQQLAFLDDNNEIHVMAEKLSLADILVKYSNHQFLESQKFSTICIECTFESYNLEARNAAIQMAQKLGISLITINPRETANYRKSHNIPKTDQHDAEIILRMFLNGKPFEPARLYQNNEDDKQWKEFYKQLARYRNQNWEKTFKNVNHEIIREADKYLKRLEQEKQFLYELGDGKRKFSIPFVGPLILMALETSSRTEFDKRIGMCSNGYPSIIRSNIYNSRLNALLLREFSKRNGGKVYHLKSFNTDEVTRERKKQMQNLRRAVRYVFGKVKEYQEQTGTSYSETGTGNSDVFEFAGIN
jgi:hypothetical protein